VGRLDELLEKLPGGTSDANFTFAELRYILLRLGFDERIHGSHHVYRIQGQPSARAVIQPDGKNAKPYRVAQVRNAVLALKTGGTGDGQV
jgi:hypothetical protein